MKKAIIIAIILITVGILIVFCSFCAVNFDFSRLSSSEIVKTEYFAELPFSDITINSPSNDIVFLPSEDTRCKIVCISPENTTFSAKVENGTLIFRENPKKWYQYIFSISFGKNSVTVYLPEDDYKTLSVRQSTGGTEIKDDFSFENIDIKTSTGDISLSCGVSGFISLKTATGKVNIKSCSPESMNVKSDTGGITLSDIDAKGRLFVETDTGKVDVSNVNSASAEISTETGNIILHDLVVRNKMEIESDTGNVSLNACDAYKIDIETDTGSVSGKLLSEMTFFAHSDTGRVIVPKTVSEKTCEIETDTGNIDFE